MEPGRKHPVHVAPVARHNEPIILFLTVCTKDRTEILACPEVADLLRHAWDEATSWLVGHYLIMPDHLHLFCAPAALPERPVGQWVRYWKTLASRRWPRPLEHPIWQLDFWDTQLRSVRHYGEKWTYVRENPVRAGLVRTSDEWPWQGECHELRW